MSLKFIHSLQFKLALGILLVSLVPLAVVGVFSARTADQLIEGIVSNQLENVASDKQQMLQRWVGERRADLEVVAASPLVETMDPSSIAPYLKVVQDRYQVYRRFVITGLDGKVVYDSIADGPKDSSREVWYQAGMRGQRYISPVHPGG